MFGIDSGLISLIQSILLIISALLIIIAAIGALRIDRNLDNVVYARIHILGIVDVAGIIAFIALGQPLFALIYLFLAPLLAHALANAYFHGEDTINNPVLNPKLLEEVPEDDSIEEEVLDGDSIEENGVPEELSDSEGISDSEEPVDLDLSDDSSVDDESSEDSDSADENLDEKSEDDGND